MEKVNPFDEGVTYVQFNEALGKAKVKDYLKGICTDQQIDFIEKELETLKTIK